MRALSKKGIVATARCALTLGLMAAGSTAAHADVAPGNSDIVGVGSDTLQYMLDFGADGDLAGDPGYNAGKLNRVFSFDATPDANARAGYLNGSTSTITGIKPLNPTIVLRAGSSPVQRPNGSGAGLSLLDLDTNHKVDFVRSSSALTQATTASHVGSIREIRLAHETLAVAAGNTTNAVPLTAAQLKTAYLCNGGPDGLGNATGGPTRWSDVGGTSSDLIIPIIPQPGSGTRKTFLQGIGFTVASDGSTTPALGSCVKTYEENDPYALYVDSSGNQSTDPYLPSSTPNVDAIEPMSSARLALYQSGYFQNPNQVLYGTAPNGEVSGTLSPAVQLITTGYTNERGLYVFFRESDVAVTGTNHFNGTSKNWVQSLFYVPSGTTGTPYFKGSAGQGLLAAAGVTPDYADCGDDPTAAGACGPFNG